jgi:ribosome-associated toxin RatA of RatAB toxin-antitoxin module
MYIYKKYILYLYFALSTPAKAETDSIKFDFTWVDDSLSVEAFFATKASRSVIWNTLVDYKKIPHFVTFLSSSEIIKRDGDEVYLKQEGKIYWFYIFPIQFEVQLYVREFFENKLVFEDRILKDFKMYKGEWKIESSNGKNKVTYRLSVKPRNFFFKNVSKDLLLTLSEGMLMQVAGEIERRKALCLEKKDTKETCQN